MLEGLEDQYVDVHRNPGAVGQLRQVSGRTLIDEVEFGALDDFAEQICDCLIEGAGARLGKA